MDEIQESINVLVVDDEVGYRDLLKWEMGNRIVCVKTAENGAQGIRMARETKFDVIITDVSMPEMDGLAFLKEIRKTAPRTKVIIATGFGAVETAVYAMKNGAYDFVLKPYDLEYLKQRVRQAVDPSVRCRECGRPMHE